MFDDSIEFFLKRLTQLRLEKDVSAREMSLDLGQNPGYISRIENRQSLPSFENICYICDYFHLSLPEFFSETPNALKSNELSEKLKKLTTTQLTHLEYVVDDLLEKERK
ncbi:MAG: helix-turn-helix domain-containing protein [Oscillospiraceae bacterium]